jgi:hypothetical protein
MPITGNPNDPEFTSEHQYLLFLSLPVLRQFAPDLLPWRASNLRKVQPAKTASLLGATLAQERIGPTRA